MATPIDIAVVGHTNVGKTSLLRTLVRRFPGMALAQTPQRRPEFVIRGLQELSVTLR